MSCYLSSSAKEQHLVSALRHLIYKNHDLVPNACEGCLEIAAFVAVPGYQGNDHPEVH